MASLTSIRDAIKATIEANITGLRVYDTVPDLVNPPALIVMPLESDFNVMMARGTDRYLFDLIVLCSATVPRTSQDALDAFLTGAGARSVRAVIFANRGLGLSDGTEAHVPSFTAYAKYPVASVDHIGARLRLVVTTPGTA